uniref:Uncharacterized protein n=1 Tax=Neogobius melanostomus TaxID=47308 RepID=A0A8C6U931_9GOBI
IVFNLGTSNAHLSLESISSSGLSVVLTTASISSILSGARMDWTINLCLLLSFGSYSKGCSITEQETQGI